jgi:hypothetical protein
VGLLAKVGVGGRAGAWRYGASLTTPTIRLAGTGTRSVDRAVAIAEPGTGLLLEYLMTATQSDLRSDYRTPLAAGAGIARDLGRATVHLAAEWYDALGSTTVLDADPVIDEQTTGPIDIDLRIARRSIVNWGLGLEYEMTGTVSGFAGYHTDRSTVSDDDPRGALAGWDIDHWSAGVSLSFDDKRIAIGLVYAAGTEPLENAVDLLPGSLDGPETTSLPRVVDARYRDVMLLLGFDVDY